MIKAIIFDFDGVIAESVDIKTRAFAKLFEREGEKAVKKVVKYHLDNGGVSRYEKFRYIYKEILRRRLDDATFKNLCDQFSQLVKDGVIKSPYVAGAKEFLENHKNQYKFFVLSATPAEEIKEIIDKKGLNNYFLKIYGSPSNKMDIVNEIIFINQLEPTEVIYIGDALSDYRAAKANFIHFVARICHGNNPLFKDINCPRIKDLTGFHLIIKKLSASSS